MSKDEEETRVEEILASIKDPKVREHYRAQLKMAAELEQEGVVTAYHDVDVFREEREKRENEDQERFAELVAEKVSQKRKATVDAPPVVPVPVAMPSLQTVLRTAAGAVLLWLLIVVAVGVLGVVGIALWKGWALW